METFSRSRYRLGSGGRRPQCIQKAESSHIRVPGTVFRFARSRKTRRGHIPATLRGKALDLSTDFPCQRRLKVGIQSP